MGRGQGGRLLPYLYKRNRAYEIRVRVEFRRVLFRSQAEDGIRDSSVTGVQTCALPIFKSDTYTLGESGPSGYTAGSWTCVLTGTQTAVLVSNSQVIVGLGKDVTCTINNNDEIGRASCRERV